LDLTTVRIRKIASSGTGGHTILYVTVRVDEVSHFAGSHDGVRYVENSKNSSSFTHSSLASTSETAGKEPYDHA
jgi:hypothetical protein